MAEDEAFDDVQFPTPILRHMGIVVKKEELERLKAQDQRCKDLEAEVARLKEQVDNLSKCCTKADDVAYKLRCELSAANVTESPARTALIELMKIDDEYVMEGGSLFHENGREDVYRILRVAGLKV